MKKLMIIAKIVEECLMGITNNIMAENSKISWCQHSANLVWGCARSGIGCQNCYAEVLSKRWGHDLWGHDKPRKIVKSVWSDLAKFQKLAKEAGEIHRVFVGSMMDIFEKPMPLIDNKGKELAYMSDFLRSKLFNEVIPASPNLMFLLLTKRPSNINKYIPESWKINPPSNVMFGTSPVNQETANTLIPQLLQVKGKRFLSVEPMLDEINLRQTYLPKGRLFGDDKDWWLQGINWLIVGGESGHYRRPFNIDWARSLRDQCKSANVSFFFKQIDGVNKDFPLDLQIQQFPE